MKISGAGSEFRQRNGSMDPDPDPNFHGSATLVCGHWTVTKIIVHSRLDSRESKKKTDKNISASKIHINLFFIGKILIFDAKIKIRKSFEKTRNAHKPKVF
jgi:hypothetical protein